MKLPIAPRPLDELLARHRDDLPKVLQSGFHRTVDDRYVHWDTLRRLEPPAGLDHEQWWVGIKLARFGDSRHLPLCDAGGRSFTYTLPGHVQDALHRIDRRASGWVGAPDQVVNPGVRDRLIINSLIDEAVTSSQLEGASTTRPVAAEMIRTGRRPRDRSERMILNNYLAMQAVRGMKDAPLTLDAVLRLHATVTADTLDDPGAAGRVQTPGEERVRVWDPLEHRILHTPPPAERLPERMDALIRFANQDTTGGPFLHPVVRAIALHFWLAYDHPFEDGNGRTARALFYWAMLRDRYWMCEFISISRLLKQAPARYARAFLYTETDGNDLTYFIVHQVEVLLRAFADLDAYIAKKVEEVGRVERLLRQSTDLNHRQLALLSHAIRHPDGEYTMRSHMTSHRVAYATARADLYRLAALGFLERRRIGRKSNVFSVPIDLEERIRSAAHPVEPEGRRGD